MKKAIYIILSILFLVLSLPPINFSFLIFVAFVPLFLLARECRFVATAVLGAVVGAAYFGALFYWIGIYTPIGASAVILLASIYFGLYLALTGYFLKRSTDVWFDWLFPGALWISAKWLISFWKPGLLVLHIPDSLGLELRQSIYLVGENGLVLFIFLVNGWIYNFVRVPKPTREHMIQLLVLAILLLGMNSFARSRFTEPIPEDIPVAVIQPNLAYDVKWREEHYDEIKSVYDKLTREAAGSNPTLIIWPQYAFPEDLRKTPNPASELARELATPILLGTYVNAPDGSPLNEALYFNAEGKLAGEYAATFLPPFRFTGQKKGDTFGLIDTTIGKVGVLLCFEDTHPSLTRQLVKRGAEIMVLLCNDQFFGRSSEPYLHASRLRLRAIEADRFFIRAAPTGFSEIIDPRGRVLQSTQLFSETVLTGKVRQRSGVSPYFFLGDLVSYAALGLLFGLLAQSRFRRGWKNPQ